MKKYFMILFVFIFSFWTIWFSKAADLTKLKSFINIIVSNKQWDTIKLNELKWTITSTLTLAIEKTKDLPATNEKKKDLLEILNYFLATVDEAIENPKEVVEVGGNLWWWNWTVWARVALNWTQKYANYWFRNFNTTKTTTISSMTESALRAAVAWWWTIIIPAWTININWNITPNSNTKIIWAWAWKTILSYKWPWVHWIIKINGKTNIVLQDFTIDWNNVMNKSHGIHVTWSAKNFLIKWLHIKDIWAKERWRAKFDPNPAKSDESSWMAIWYSGWSNFTIDWNTVSDVAKHWIFTQWTASYWIIKNNYIKNSFMWINTSGWAKYIEVFNNEIEGTLFWWKFAWSSNSSFHDNYIHNLFKFSYIRDWKRENDSQTGFAYQLTWPNMEILDNQFYWQFHLVVTSWWWATVARNSGNKVISSPLPRK